MENVEIKITFSSKDSQFENVNEILKNDYYLLSGDIIPDVERQIITGISKYRNNKNACLILTTPGGDADTAYRLARKIGRQYENFMILVNGYCKSAGTLLALGAKQLIVTPDAEFGPLDVQLFGPDEFIKRSSGLTVTQAVEWINQKTFEAFENIFLNLRRRSGGNITTKTAGDIASAIVSGLYSTITEKIDPVVIGEMQRATDIAIEYGKRLGVDSRLISHLVSGYPSHSFVIDFEETLQIFPNYRIISKDETFVLNEIDKILFKELNYPCTEEPIDGGLFAAFKLEYKEEQSVDAQTISSPPEKLEKKKK